MRIAKSSRPIIFFKICCFAAVAGFFLLLGRIWQKSPITHGYIFVSSSCNSLLFLFFWCDFPFWPGKPVKKLYGVLGFRLILYRSSAKKLDENGYFLLLSFLSQGKTTLFYLQ
jgi:hypothetical protein